MNDMIFIKCEKCGKKLIVKNDLGYFHFAFGRILDETGEAITVEDEGGRMHPLPAVEMMVHGELKMKCISRECRKKFPNHWNALSLFANPSGENIDKGRR